MRNNLGFVAVSPSPDPFSMAFNAAMMFAPLVTNFIGRGRREADAIVPYQRELYARIQTVLLALQDPSVTADQLKAMQQALADHWAWMQDFLFSSQFTDRRASEQGYGDMRVYVEGLTADGRTVTAHPNPDRGGQLGTEVPPGGALGALQSRIETMLGFDWDRLIDLGYTTVERILPGNNPGSYVVYRDGQPVLYDPSIGGSYTVTAPAPPPPAAQWPDWAVPAMIGGTLLVGGLMFMPRSRR